MKFRLTVLSLLFVSGLFADSMVTVTCTPPDSASQTSASGSCYSFGSGPPGPGASASASVTLTLGSTGADWNTLATSQSALAVEAFTSPFNLMGDPAYAQTSIDWSDTLTTAGP